MAYKWVCNASPLILLHRISHLRLLSELCDSITIPQGVIEEILPYEDNMSDYHPNSGDSISNSLHELAIRLAIELAIKYQYKKRLPSDDLFDNTLKKQFFIDISPMEGFEHIERQYNAIVEAMDNKEEIEIVYKAMKSRQESKRVIAPYGLYFHDGLWYVVGYCHMRREIRTFALDCIKAFEITSRPYSMPSDFKIAEYFKPGWHMIRYGEPVEVILKFEERYVRWIKRRTWHPTQAIEENKDGSIILKVRIEGTRELKWWTYHWIPYCEILAPVELREEVIREMQDMLRVYSSGQP